MLFVFLFVQLQAVIFRFLSHHTDNNVTPGEEATRFHPVSKADYTSLTTPQIFPRTYPACQIWKLTRPFPSHLHCDMLHLQELVGTTRRWDCYWSISSTGWCMCRKDLGRKWKRENVQMCSLQLSGAEVLVLDLISFSEADSLSPPPSFFYTEAFFNCPFSLRILLQFGQLFKPFD